MIDQPPESDEGSGVMDEVKGRLVFSDVSFRYSTSAEDVLDEIDFVVPPGTTTALVGPSGSGKTTIASLVPRFYTVTGGAILLDDTDISDVTLNSLRNQISYVGQESVLFNDTVAANICYGSGAEVSREAMEEAARAAYALDFVNALPEGFDTVVGEDGVILSGGQRQRIAIARALLKDAPVLILDEATSALDTESERYVQSALHNLTRNRTTLVIAHRLSTIVHADQILVINEGKVVERGSHAELIALGGQYSTLYQNQFEQS